MMIEAIGPFNSGTTTGGAGTSTNNATGTIKITGELLGFYLRFNDSPPGATTDTTIVLTGGVLPARTVLTITNGATDGFYPVRQGAVSTANAAITDSNVEIPCIQDYVKVTLAQANDGDSVDVWAVIDR
jgi:hypothetical protein